MVGIFLRIFKEKGTNYEIKMFDEYGIPANIEIYHADDFVNMIVSARQIKCEYKSGEDK